MCAFFGLHTLFYFKEGRIFGRNTAKFIKKGDSMKNKLTLRKIFNLIQAVLLTATLIIIFVAPYGEYTRYNWLTKFDPNIGYYKSEMVSDYVNETIVEQGTFHFSDFLNVHPVQTAFLLIPVVLIVICFALAIFSVIRKSTHRDSMLHIVVPILAVIIYALFTSIFIEVAGGPVFTVYSGTNPLLPVAAIMGIVIILSFIKRSKSFNPENKVKVEISAKSDADELKKFKELFDAGIINQEEFDAKKKELLGL